MKQKKPTHKNKSENKVSVSKKGSLDDFGDLFVGAIAITALLIILLIVILSVNMQVKKYSDLHIKFQETSRSTRLMLDQETTSGQKIYELIIQQEETGNYAVVGQELNKTLEKIYGSAKGTWLLIIRDSRIQYWEYLKSDPDVTIPEGVKYLTEVSIPNGKGKLINVTIRKIEPSDDLLNNVNWNKGLSRGIQ